MSHLKENSYGYTNNKSALQDRINEYIKTGEEEHTAFVKIDELPEYQLCLLKKHNKSNDDEIFEKIKETGTTYYKYYAVTESSEEKLYVSTKEEAETIIEELKKKDRTNKDKIAYVEKYSTELADFKDTQTAVAALYIKPVPVVTYSSINTSYSINTGAKINLGISLIRPVSGIITSRFGYRGRGTHTGLDIAASQGTAIHAVSGGKVIFSGDKGSYGKLVIVDHGNGIQTYYAHCSALYVSSGAQVSQGQTIAAVGSTGNSTGPHLHLEIRVNGVAQNPQNYLY